MVEGTTRISRRIIVVLISALIGIAIFLLLYGTHVLNPGYTDWLMDGGSLSKGYLGWRLFQSSDWQFPPGLMASLGYPQQASIAATDSIPLLALVSKLLSPLFDEPFQYIGCWGLICFLLQGIFGALISLRVTRTAWQALLGSLFFLLSPVLWQGTFFTAGMAGHWVILAALLPIVFRKELSMRSKPLYSLWGVLGAISILIHGQLALICGIFCVGYCFYAVVKSGQWGSFLPVCVFFLSALVAGWVVGAFSAGNFSINILGIDFFALWDSHNYSTILRNFSNPADYQYAGFAYLGFGALVLLVLAFIWLVKPYFSQAGTGKAIVDDMRAHLADAAALTFISIMCILLGLAQPIVYLVMALMLSGLAHKMSKRLLTVALACCLCLQAYDASTVFKAKKINYDQEVVYADMAAIDKWEELLQNDAWSIVLISPAVSESAHLAPMAEAIAQSGKTLNTLSYVSDSDYSNWNDIDSNPTENMIFVYTAEEMLDAFFFEDVFANISYLYQWDDLIVGFSKPTLLPLTQILGVEDITYTYRYPIGENMHLRGGEDFGGIRYIYPGGLSYGPYLTLTQAQYELRITGEHLDEAKIWFTVYEGAMEPSEVLSTSSERVFHISVTDAVSGMEVLIENSTAQTMYFDAITVTQLD